MVGERDQVVTRRRALLAFAGFVGMAAAACGGPSAPGGSRRAAPADSAPGASQQGAGSQKPAASQMTVVIPSSDLALGRNRLTLALLDGNQIPVPDARLHLKLYHPIEPAPVLKSEADATFRFVDDRRRGLYVSYVTFDAPGLWGLEVSGARPDGQPIGPARVRLPQPVAEKSRAPGIGDPAPRSRNLTARDVDDIRKIDSGVTPNDMHDLTIAEALEQGKPLVVLFASPGFCVTQTCGPQVEVVQQLKAKYRDAANFVHIEVYKDPQTRTPYETVLEWGLTSEPWLFMVDRTGRVADRFEGPAPLDELEPALARLLEGS